MMAARKPLQAHNTEDLEARETAATKQLEKVSESVTPTRVLRSGRRIAATPQQPKTARKRAERVQLEEQPSGTRDKVVARRVPTSPQEPGTDRRSTRLRAQRQPVGVPKSKPDRPYSSQKKAARSKIRGLEETPISSLIELTESLHLRADRGNDALVPPAGLLTEIRKAQQDIHNEQKLVDLRAEILAFQEDIRLEAEESEEATSSSTTEPSSSASFNRYQDTPSSRMPRGGPFSGQEAEEQEGVNPEAAAHESLDSPCLKVPQNTPAVANLVAFKDMVLGSSSSEEGSECSHEESETGFRESSYVEKKASGESAAVAAEIHAKLNALRMSQETQGSGLETDGSDTAEKLAALRTKLALDDSPEAADLLEISRDEEEAGAEPFPEFVPRHKQRPTFMERKLQHLQDAEWSGSHSPKPHMSGLERAKKAAAETRLEGLSSAERAAAKRMVATAVSNAVKTEGKSLGESLVRHKSRLELEKEAALASLADKSAELQARPPRPAKAATDQGLGEVLQKHKSRLQLEKEAAASRAEKEGSLPRFMRPTAASRHATSSSGSLGESLLVHQSRLEKEKAAAKEAAWDSTTRPAAPKTERHGLDWGELADMKVHKSQLERAKELALQNPKARPAPSHRPEAATSKSERIGGLGDLKVHKSRLEREKEAWAKAAARNRK